MQDRREQGGAVVREDASHEVLAGEPADVARPPTRVAWDASSLLRGRPVAQARRRAAHWVRDQWELPDLVDDVELIVGELSTNAVRHGGGMAGLEMLLVRPTPYSPSGLRVLVSDYRPEAEPIIERSDELSEHGRGLEMIVALSLRWGWHRVGTDQKQVWCRLAHA